MLVDIYNTNKKYSVIYADPPWEYSRNKTGICRGTLNLPYPTMSTEQICELPIKNISNSRSILFIWATFPKLQDCLKVIEAWGFTYNSLGFDWTKICKNGTPFIGMGYYTRQNNEVCLVGVHKEKIKIFNHSISCVVQSLRREHSRKPDEVRKHIDSLCGDVSKIELFARQEFSGWDCWGNQTSFFEKASHVEALR